MALYFDEDRDLDKYISIAKQFNENCNPSNLLGSGMYGLCFQVDSGRAVKITGDDFEVSLAIRLLDCDVDSMPNVHKVTPASEYGLWLIEMDLCQPLEKSEINSLEQIFEVFHEYDEHAEDGTLSSFRYFLEEEGYDNPLLVEIEELIELASMETGFRDLDFHLDNLMRRNGKLVLIDQKNTKQSTFDTKLVNAVLADYRETNNFVNWETIKNNTFEGKKGTFRPS